ncbi:MAG: 7-cyano-7-deazaguanine synthase QueC [Candidatus Omnitrophica bacterium]|nr:7-cyano-7-deazaguanine synthase QueC [Candidatus Omnitrophota bacterium]MBU1127830.1 7-cyano-7-deazaguanine synthase QueC [Candidatus Omnitrophota bacterium]MBU1657300.1 7-cyano-7-deazaguanine synthase QueC [Candidatus Omnitrophota bacterium]MBU1783720.1 7-cyano-7-deazaguanine synthase QueC [Candidatus Omnitrophota bacterium]MBU1851173.1 7-cyano-7-deazaguanine synthase QueC [Candidatus Omnitrophota bacterium]
MKKAVVLLSGGLDSAVTCFIAKREYECHALVFDYGQKAKREIESAKNLAEEARVFFQIIKLPLSWRGNALTDDTIEIPDGDASADGKIPVTYVPARNIVFLSFGVSFAEAIGAEAVFIGAHQMDFSNYPDCRSSFFESFEEAVRCGTKSGTRGGGIKIMTPIINMTKKEIVEEGIRLGVPFQYTWSCYRDGGIPCGSCESCLLRAKGFVEAGGEDPLIAKNRNEE